jgi:RND family efflux transporter MFP subunit
MIKNRALATLLIAAVFLSATSGCSGKGEKGEAKGPVAVVKGVTLEEITENSITDETEAVGTVRAGNSSTIAARIAGTVSIVLVQEGERVAKGKPLLNIDAAESVAGAAGARAAADEAGRGVEEARARKRLADATFGRYSSLFSGRAVTRQEFDGKKMERDVARQGLARAEAGLVRAREEARAAGTMAGYARVTSPIAGIVTRKSVDAGVTVFPGTPLLTVEEEGRYRLEAAAPESLMGKVKPGDQLRVAIDGFGTLNGKVAEVVPAADPASRTFTVKVDIAAKGLRSGIFGRVFIPVGSRRGITIPRSALKENGVLTSVWVVGKDNIARMRLVRTGRESDDRIEVLSGLSSGERIVVNGTEKVADGAKVE